MRLIMLFTITGVGVVLGTECIAGSQKATFHSSVLVFRGTVMKIEDPTPENISSEPGKVALQTFDPTSPKIVALALRKMWKGPAASSV